MTPISPSVITAKAVIQRFEQLDSGSPLRSARNDGYSSLCRWSPHRRRCRKQARMCRSGGRVSRTQRARRSAKLAENFFVMMVRGWHSELTCRTRCVYSFTNGNTLRPLRTSVFFASSLDSEKTGCNAGPRDCDSRLTPSQSRPPIAEKASSRGGRRPTW